MGELVQYENKYYQWIKGDFIGRVETVNNYLDENGLNFVVFESGKRINESLLLEYLIEVPEYQAKIAEQAAIAEPLSSSVPSGAFHASPDTSPGVSPYNTPVMNLLMAQKIENSEELKISLEIKVPKKEIVSVLKASFGNEIEEDLYQYVSQQLDDSSIKNEIKNKIKKFIIDYYESNS